ncbi:alpha/beta fold hydrolase [Blastococcus sp. TF02A-30]|uniref:alpha/beta fold hydrolase n=1 Tax=Blastococcus sp. TF02A-30 TaxID=2250580 RepID=UPI000DE9DA31|nr:alpha/beta fold hydrolase [Blastococcus sp. TF02A-30]RBY92580.1 alpha/beta hydrolase [Blastococcus sp. TF02A-30]
MAEPRLEVRWAEGTTRAVALFCHGGAAAGLEPPRERALSLVRMRAVEQFVAAAGADRGLTTCLLRYRLAGWNGDAADAFADTRWALERIAEEHGDVPVVLVGHSMGGRAVLRAGGAAAVTAVCALAPWTPPGEPVEHLRDRTVAILHGRGDRWVPSTLSAHFAVRARRAGVPVARFTVAGGHSMVRRAHAWHAFARDVVLAGAGFAPLRPDVAAALRAGGTEGLAVPLAA